MRLVRNSADKVIGGVCAGLGQYFGISVKLLRFIFVIAIPLPGPAILTYIILWIVLPWDYQVAQSKSKIIKGELPDDNEPEKNPSF